MNQDKRQVRCEQCNVLFNASRFDSGWTYRHILTGRLAWLHGEGCKRMFVATARSGIWKLYLAPIKDKRERDRTAEGSGLRPVIKYAGQTEPELDTWQKGASANGNV